MAEKNKKILKGINPRVWEHPADKAALGALKKIPGLDELVRMFIGITTEKSFRLLALSSAVRVSEKQFPRINTLIKEACEILDIEEIPEVFVKQEPSMNAMAIGVKSPFIILNSSLIGKFSESELLAVIGHELGHIYSGHVLYKTLLWLLLHISWTGLQNFPIGGLAMNAIIIALKEWERKSELSADRAGLLVNQDKEAAYTVEMKLAGGNFVDQMDIDEFFNQAKEYEEGGDILDSVYKLLNIIGESHPFSVLRLKELKTWVDSGEFDKILNGDYQKGEDVKDNIFKDFENAKNSYQEDILSSKDPLAKTMSNIGQEMEKIGKDAEDFFKNLFK